MLKGDVGRRPATDWPESVTKSRERHGNHAGNIHSSAAANMFHFSNFFNMPANNSNAIDVLHCCYVGSVHVWVAYVLFASRTQIRHGPFAQPTPPTSRRYYLRWKSTRAATVSSRVVSSRVESSYMCGGKAALVYRIIQDLNPGLQGTTHVFDPFSQSLYLFFQSRVKFSRFPSYHKQKTIAKTHKC